jgi:hypothetical protein
MKAQILKIAGVKTEAEFYKKFPTEEAFMKKHGKELKKAQYGTYVAGQKEQPAQKPLIYDDLYQDTLANMTGISKEERARQDMLASQQAIADSNASSSQGQGIGDILKNIDPEMITSMMGAIGGAKNGKKMKKAQNGLQGIIKPPPMPKVEMVNLAKTKGFGLNKLENIPASTDRSFDYTGAAKEIAGQLAPQLGSLIGNIEQIQQNKKDIKRANQWADISEISAQAALSRPEQSKRRYVRPEDNLVTGANPLGKRDSLLAAENGAEIANTFAPNTIYTDLGYEPLDDSNLKQYAYGGHLQKAAGGINLDPFAGIAGSIGGVLGSAAGKGTGRGGPGSAIGSTIGGALGTLIPIPGVGTALGSFIGGGIGGLFDANDQNQLKGAQDRQSMAVGKATVGRGMQSYQQQNKAIVRNGGKFESYEDGGWMNPEYNPQVIAKFGDYSMDQLLAPPHDADMLRAGGHLKEYTPPSERAMYTGRNQMEDGGQMAMGGDLEVHWGGNVEEMSYNPFLPGDGITYMPNGQSHDETNSKGESGIGITYGNNPVEIERKEPMVKLQDGGSPDGNLVVYGNMIIPDYGVAELGDKNAKGKKFKHYVADLSKVEAKQNKLVDKTTQLINNADTNDQFEKLSLNTGQANLIGATMKLKDIAEKKKTAAAVQNAILDTAKEMGLESDALAKGKIKYAKANDPYAEFGAELDMAQKGKKVKKKSTAAPVQKQTSIRDLSNLSGLYDKAVKTKDAMAIGKFQRAALNTLGADEIKKITGVKNTKKFVDGIFGKGTDALGKALSQKIQSRFVPAGPNPNDPIQPLQYPEGEGQNQPTMIPGWMPSSGSFIPGMSSKVSAPVKSESDLSPNENSWWETGLTALTSALPFIRPTNQIPLDPSQLSGELYALSQNQEEPVFAQSYQPMLSQPISISLQDQLNEITAQSRAAERVAQGNPAALAMIASQAAEAKNKVLGEQFRMNQGEAQRVAETNRQTMNEAARMNLGLFDQQQQRASQARSNTKMQNIVALNSINDKILKQKAENRQVGIMENLYNYRFSPSGVAYNMNPLANFAPYGSGGMGKTPAPEGYEYETILKKKKTSKSDDTEVSRNGSIVKAIKGL